MDLTTLLQNPAIMHEIVKTLKSNPQMAFQLMKAAAPDFMVHLDHIRDALYRGTTKEEQLFISQNIAGLAGFLNTKPGAAAITELVAKWKEHTLPPKIPDQPQPTE